MKIEIIPNLIDQLNEEIRGYTPGKFTKCVLRDDHPPIPSHVTIALYGETSAGKSSLIRSFMIAIGTHPP